MYPVIFFTFKRPHTTYQFLERFVQAGVKKIYIFADGPRNNKEEKLTAQVKKEIIRFISNNPQIIVIVSYSNKNIGLKDNIISGLNSVFSTEQAAIIVEDDTLPHPDFFRFCNTMLTKYSSNPKVFSINGTSVGGRYRGSYDFTKYSQCWGWATWKRAWNYYDPKMQSYSKQKWHILAKDLNLSYVMTYYFQLMFYLVKVGQINTWDFQWSYAHFYNHALAISPVVNLIQNIGFDDAATNTKVQTSVSRLILSSLPSSIIDPNDVSENMSVSRQIEHKFYANPIAILGLIRQYLYWYWKRLW